MKRHFMHGMNRWLEEPNGAAKHSKTMHTMCCSTLVNIYQGQGTRAAVTEDCIKLWLNIRPSLLKESSAVNLRHVSSASSG